MGERGHPWSIPAGNNNCSVMWSSKESQAVQSSSFVHIQLVSSAGTPLFLMLCISHLWCMLGKVDFILRNKPTATLPLRHVSLTNPVSICKASIVVQPGQAQN